MGGNGKAVAVAGGEPHPFGCPSLQLLSPFDKLRVNKEWLSYLEPREMRRKARRWPNSG
jgi:hypothetical protein